METPLKQLLYECSKGLYYELRLKNTFDDAAVLKVYEDEIAKRLGNSSDARWELAFTIARLVRSGAWVAFHEATVQLCNKWDHEHPGCSSHGNPYNPIGGNWWRENPIYLFTFLKEKFGLCRTTVYNLLEVVDTFATYIDDKGKQPEYSINAEAKQFQFWQLVEMLSLTYQERLKVQPN